MNSLITNVNQAILDFNSIKQAIINKGIEIPQGIPTSKYSELINSISVSMESNILPHSEGLTYYFDYQKNISATNWKDVVHGYPIDSDMIHTDEYVSPQTPIYLDDWDIKNTFTAYGVFKCQNNSNDVMMTFGFSDPDGTRWFCSGVGPTNKICFLEPAQNSVFDYSAADYHVCAFSFFEGQLNYYIDGKKVYASQNSIDLFTRWRIACSGTNRDIFFKAVIFYENTAQSSDTIIENSQYIAQKYGIQI